MALPNPRGNGGQVAERSDDPRRQAVAWLNSENIKDQVERALPNHVPFDWFMRAAQTAILNKPELANADRPSLLRELVAVAQLGLVLDPQLGEAWLIVDRNGKVQRRVGYQGLRKLALQSGKVTALNAQAVRENDPCEIRLGDSPGVTHTINVKAPDRGVVLGCYAIGKVEGTNEPVVEWMSWRDIEEHRDRYSDAGRGKKSGPWADPLAEVEMARKTVFRRLCKWLPKSPLLAEALAHEDRMDVDLRDVTPRRGALPAPEEPDEGQAESTQPSEAKPDIPQTNPGRPVEQSEDGDEEKQSWTIGNKTYVQPGRVQTELLRHVELCEGIDELDYYMGDREGAKLIQSLPPANREAIENAIAARYTIILSTPDPESEADDDEPGRGGRGQFNLLSQ